MKISDEILKEVAKKSLENAKALMSDADILREANRYQRAYAIYQFAMEEVGKAISSILLLILIDPNEKDFKEFERSFKSHTSKIKRSRALDSFICQVIYKGDFDGALNFLQSSISENENQLDQSKNNSLYTNIIDSQVKKPSEMISENQMNYIWLRAISRYKIAQPFVTMALEHYETLREYQREHGSIKNMSLDAEEVGKEFWDEIIGKE
ncbi:MAG TPA: AbiV family abortive infection protein [Panacibacter sp.]|nr:AbiV family abortive infection protein [Panacibacter sp.]